MRFLHTADWQIGMKRHFLDEDAQSRFSDARETVIRRMGQVVQEYDCAFVVVAGDVFESNLLRPRTVQRALDAMGAISVPVYLLPGNHDHLGPSTIYHSREFIEGKPANVHVLDSDASVSVLDHVELVGVPWLAKQLVEDRVGNVVKRLPRLSGAFRVVIGHGATSAMGDSDVLGVIDIDLVEEAVRQNRVQYVALGDRHSTTSVGSTGRIWYAGAPEPTDYDETDSGQVLVVDLRSDSVEVKPVQVGTWRFVERVLDVQLNSAEMVLEQFLQGIPDKAHTIVKVNFRGAISLNDQLRIVASLDKWREIFGAIERHEHRDQLAILPESGEFQDLSLSGYAEDALTQLIELASRQDAEGQPYRDALALYYRLAKEG